MNSIIIVPYRDRPEHLTKFLAHMDANYTLPICIVEQAEGKPFNRGKLLNIGYLENRESYSNYIFHDVDMLPINVEYTPYGYVREVKQLAGSDIQNRDYLGGVTLFNVKAFIDAGGYHNDYFHRAEDNEMRFNLKRLGINVIEKPGTFISLPHERKGPEFDRALWNKAQQKRKNQNQLSVCEYRIVNQTIIGNVRHIIVEI